jgi:5-methylthioadenosine/S-adenosylhomocysteine deaminase
MTPIDRLLECRWVVPVEPSGVVLEDHAIAIEGGRIRDVLPIDVARSRFAASDVTTLATHAVIPGLVNAHTHAAMTLLRGVGDDLPLMRWLQERIWPLEAKFVSDRFVHDGTLIAAHEMLRAGTTCCSDMYFFPEAAATALREAGMRCAVGIIAIEFPTAYATDADDYLRKGLAVRDAFTDDPLVSFTLAPHAPYTVSDATLARIAMLAEELDLPIHMHIHETAGEIDESLARHGVRPLERLDRLGVVTERLLAVHAVHLNDAEIGLLAQRGASVAHCPTSNLKLASGIARIAALHAAGVGVAIGTDGAASNNRLDVLGEMRLAALLAKGASGDAAALPAAAVLECATLQGARALGLEQSIGSIVPGKQADLCAIDLASLETQPVFDPISHLAYACGREHVTDVWIAGDPVVQMRQVVHKGRDLDLTQGLRAMGAWQNQFRQFLEAQRS